MAARFAAVAHGRLSVVHIEPPEAFDPVVASQRVPVRVSLGETGDPAQKLVTEQARRVDGDPVLLRGGSLAATACAWAAHESADLLVAAAHRGFVARATLGSFAAYLAHHAPCTSLFVRPNHDGPRPEAAQHIACCVDDSPAARGALAEASLLADALQARLSVLHVEAVPFAIPLSWSEPPEEDFFTAAQRRVAALAATFENATPTPIFGFGYPPALTCEWAKENDVDLLMAAAHRGLAARIYLGSFTSYLAYHAPCSVLVTRRQVAHTLGEDLTHTGHGADEPAGADDIPGEAADPTGAGSR